MASLSTLVLLFAATIACDVVGQLCFKIGASRLPAHDGPDTAGFLRGLFSDVWLLAGIVAYIGQLILWVLILSNLPLSVAFPVASLTFLVLALACRIFLSERLDAGQFAGVVLVMAGVAVVAGAA
jgi:drug/metabolite transporter (DMT)-like permease